MVASNSSGSTCGKSQLKLSSGGGVSSQEGLKKGPWSSSEDAILIDYVRNHGEGNWNAVQRDTGLLRCGKSCRLRWANHLRPNLKKGSFSSDEERLIIELHAKLGNKWARMASQLPGRTDNEIKNYWNTRVKRLQRAGLPIYPQDIQRQDHHHHHHHHQPQQQQRHHPTFSFSSSLLPPPSHYSNPQLNPLINFPTIQNPFLSYPNNPQHLIKTFHNINGSTSNTSTNFALPLSTSPILFNQRLKSDRELLLAYPLQFKSSGFDISSTPTMGGSFCRTGLAPVRMDTELPSIQSPVPEMMTAQTSSATSGGGGGDYVRSDAANSGLLEALLEQSKALVNTEKDKEISFAMGNCKEKLLMEDDDEIYGLQDSFSQSSAGMKEKDPLEEMNDLVGDDLSGLLNNFPVTTPVPDWYDASTANSSSIGQSWSWSKNEGNSGLNSSSADIDIASQYTPVASSLVTANYPKPANVGSSCWNNMPRIC